MKWFLDLKVATKLILAFLVVSAITAVVGYVGIRNMGTINAQADAMYKDQTLGISYVKEANIDLLYMSRAEKNIILATSQTERQGYADSYNSYSKLLQTNLAEARKRLTTVEGQKLLGQLDTALAAWSPVSKQVVETALSEALSAEKASASLSMGESRQKLDTVDTVMTEIAKLKSELAQQASITTTQIYDSSMLLMILFVLGGVILGVVLGLLISRVISNPLKQGVAFAELLARGDLTQRINIDRKDEIGMLASALNNTVDRLTAVVGDILQGADNVSAGSQELSATAEQMSEGSSEQAAAAEEVSSSMEQMSSNISQNAENAMQTEKIAGRSAEDAQVGGNAVQQAVSAMREIANKIAIVDEIARQTNLLALNAAIEAARAGEFGRGFAVVAAEIRKLAERSQGAAKEITELSGSSVEIAEKAGTLLTQLLPNIRHTAELVQEINAASGEQNSGAEQISRAVSQLDKVIQQNASAAEELASTSEELAGQAEQLQGTVEFFKLNESTKRSKAADGRTGKNGRSHVAVAHVKSASSLPAPEQHKVPTNGNGHKVPVTAIALAHDPAQPDGLDSEFTEF